jgi:hypothetical protein
MYSDDWLKTVIHMEKVCGSGKTGSSIIMFGMTI